MLLLPQISISIFPPIFSQHSTSSPHTAVYTSIRTRSVGPHRVWTLVRWSPYESNYISVRPHLPEFKLLIIYMKCSREVHASHFSLFNLLPPLPPSVRFNMEWKNLFTRSHFTHGNLLQIRYRLSWTFVIPVSVKVLAWGRLFLETFWYLSVCNYELKYIRQIHYEVAVCSILCSEFLQG